MTQRKNVPIFGCNAFDRTVSGTLAVVFQLYPAVRDMLDLNRTSTLL